MDNSNKIKPLSKKLAASLIKKEASNEVAYEKEKSDIFDKKTRAQMLSDIKEGERLKLLKQIDTEKDWEILKGKLQGSRKPNQILDLWCSGFSRVVNINSLCFQ